jgi:hypothetical protein
MSLGNTFTYAETSEKAVTVQHQNEAFLLIDSLDKNYLNKEGTYITGDNITNYSNYFIQ